MSDHNIMSVSLKLTSNRNQYYCIDNCYRGGPSGDILGRHSELKSTIGKRMFGVMYRHSEDMTVVSHLSTRSQVADVGNNSWRHCQQSVASHVI
jgi:hypothetical protein